MHWFSIHPALLVASMAVFFPFPVQGQSCENVTTCPCGQTGEIFTVCVEDTGLEDPCSPWSNCESCQDEMEDCLECPEGFTGPLCYQGNSEVFCENPGPISLGQMMLEPSFAPDGISVDDPQLPQGTRLLYSCKPGYSLHGDPATVICGVDGSWSADPPICRKAFTRSSLPCSNPVPALNGRVLPVFVAGSRPKTGGYRTGTRVEYSCDEGFTLAGGSPIRTCEPSGFWSGVMPSCETDCGHRFWKTQNQAPTVTQTPNAGDWPWLVAIRIRGWIRCNGALLDATTVLTSALCLKVTDKLTLYFGKEHSEDILDNIDMQVRKKISIHVHPHFNISARNYDSDIALIRFSPRVQFTQRIQPICLPTSVTTFENLVFGNKGVVAAWGLNILKNSFPAYTSSLRLTTITIRTNQDCMAAYRNTTGAALQLTLNQFCAGENNRSHDLNFGTNGAPMVFYDPTTERYTLQGLVSIHMGSISRHRLPGEYTVFTNVYQFVPWIHCRMNRKECPVM